MMPELTRIAGLCKPLFRCIVHLDLDFATIAHHSLLNFLKPDVDDPTDVLGRQGAIEDDFIDSVDKLRNSKRTGSAVWRTISTPACS